MVADTRISRAYSKAARWQIIVTALISGISLVIGSVEAAISAIAGGLSVVAGGFVAVKMMRERKGATPGSVLISLLKAEAIKIAVIMLLLLLTFKFYQGLVPLSLIGGLAGAALASGAGLQAMNDDESEK